MAKPYVTMHRVAPSENRISSFAKAGTHPLISIFALSQAQMRDFDKIVDRLSHRTRDVIEDPRPYQTRRSGYLSLSRIYPCPDRNVYGCLAGMGLLVLVFSDEISIGGRTKQG